MNLTEKQIVEELQRKREQIAELETALRVVRRLLGGTATDETASTGTEAVQQDLVGRTIEECCVQILSERGEAHYTLLTDEATERGFRGRGKCAYEGVQRSFWDTLRRKTDVFERVAKGTFRLKQKH